MWHEPSRNAVGNLAQAAAGARLLERFFRPVFLRDVADEALLSAARFSAQRRRVASPILRRASALMRRLFGLAALEPSDESASAGLSCSTSRKADMARSIVARCCSRREITRAISFTLEAPCW